MKGDWTEEDIGSILAGLDEMGFPFKEYRFSFQDGEIVCLGRGATANVYRAEKRNDRGHRQKKYAIKVIGFGNGHADPDSFHDSLETQRQLAGLSNVVKIYDYNEVMVQLADDNKVSRAYSVKNRGMTDGDRYFLRLQFILMEELIPVIKGSRYGRTELFSEELRNCSEKEILTLAYDIGYTLLEAHKENIIHRDVKLENIFYNPRKNQYELGDFGIARITDNGFASTIAFTNGYGAPEITGTFEDRYDCTADIYSFGMVLYVLLNKLRFPGSKNYHPNMNQYTHGFVPEEPEGGSEEFRKIVLKMVSFDPDDRYQSMQEVIDDLDAMRYGFGTKFRREHLSTSAVLAAAFAVSGLMAWKVSFAPDLEIELHLPDYIFLFLCVIKGIMVLVNKEPKKVNMMILALGIYLIVTEGFMWWKVPVLLILTYLNSLMVLLFAGTVLLMKLTTWLVSGEVLGTAGLPDPLELDLPIVSDNMGWNDPSDFKWAAVLLLSLALIMFLNYVSSSSSMHLRTGSFFEKNVIWLLGAFTYIACIVAGVVTDLMPEGTETLYSVIFGEEAYRRFMDWDLLRIGTFGIIICAVLFAREYSAVGIEMIRDRRRKDS